MPQLLSGLTIFGPTVDHVYEIQTLNRNLKDNSLEFGHVYSVYLMFMPRSLTVIFLFRDLDHKLREKVMKVINGPRNMAPVPARINRGVSLLSS